MKPVVTHWPMCSWPIPVRAGPRLAVVVSLNFPDMTEVTAELVRRFTHRIDRGRPDLGSTGH